MDRTGPRGERQAERYLRRRGWQPLARNWAGPSGEIDLVVRRRGILALVEIKTRTDPRDRDAPVRPAQRTRMARTAGVYLARHPALAETHSPRLDLILVDRTRIPARITHIPDAFSLEMDRRTASGPDTRWN